MQEIKRGFRTDFEAHRDLIMRFAHKAWGRLEGAGVNMPFDDVFQELSVIYCKAKEKYNPELGITFSAYLGRAMQNDFNKIAEKLISERNGEANTRDLHGDFDAMRASVSGIEYGVRRKRDGKFNGVVNIEDIGDGELDILEMLPSSELTPEEELLCNRAFEDNMRRLQRTERIVVAQLLRQVFRNLNDEDPEVTLTNTAGREVTVKQSEMSLTEVMISMQLSRNQQARVRGNLSRVFEVDL